MGQQYNPGQNQSRADAPDEVARPGREPAGGGSQRPDMYRVSGGEGIPPLAGFWGKYFIFLSLIETGHYTLAALAVLYSVFGLYYYLRIANSMFMREPIEKEFLPLSPAMGLALAVTAFVTLAIGIFPNPMINVVNGVLGLTQITPVAQLLR